MARVNKRPYVVSVRFSEEEFTWLQQLKAFFKVTPSKILRQALNHFYYMNKDILK